MGRTRRAALLLLAGGPAMLLASAQPPTFPEQPQIPLPSPGEDDNRRLPNGKLQKDAIAKQQHEQALKDTDNLIAIAEELKAELQKAGDYVVPLSSVKKTEQIERLAKKIRGRLKG
jgi:hypothetical protein